MRQIRTAEDWVRIWERHQTSIESLIEMVQLDVQIVEQANFMPDGYVLVSLAAASRIPLNQLSEDDARRISDARVQQRHSLWNRQAKGPKQ